MDQIEDGLRGAVCAGEKPSYIKISDRRAAVEYAVSMAEKRDIIVLTGKGHELSGDQRNPISVERQKNSTGSAGWRNTRISLLIYSMKN